MTWQALGSSHSKNPDPSVLPGTNDAIHCTPDELLGLWRMTRINVRAALPRTPFDFDGGPSLPGRIRGALGHALRAISSTYETTLALEAFYGPLPSWRPRAQIPRPFNITAERRGGEISSTLTLFGRIDIERDILIRAFPMAFELGLSVDSRKGARREPLQVIEANWTVTQSVKPFQPLQDAILLFQTPYSFGTPEKPARSWDSMVVGLVERVAGMALWNGIELRPDLGQWRRLGQTMTFDGHDLTLERWPRYSGRDNGQIREMIGYRGRLIIYRPPAVLWPYLALAETTFIGGNTALGLGRFDLLL